MSTDNETGSTDNGTGRETGHKVIIQISDTHIAAVGNIYNTVDTLENLAQVLSLIEGADAPPDLLLFTGDLADKGEPEAYRRFRSTVEPFAARMGVPALYMPGNHDARPPFRKQLLDWEENDEVIDQVLWSDGLRIIAMDSTVPSEAHGELDDAQLSWLEDELAQSAPLGSILAIHHPPIPGPSPFINDIVLHKPERLGKVIAGSDVRMIVAGHAHHASAGSIVGIPVWVATATAYQLDVFAIASTSLRGIPGVAFTRIDVTEDGAVATHIPVLDALPVYEIDFETVRAHMGQKLSAKEMIEKLHPEAVGA